MRRRSYGQLFVGVLMGLAGGLYIYKPIFEQYLFQKKAQASNAPTTDAVKRES